MKKRFRKVLDIIGVTAFEFAQKDTLTSIMWYELKNAYILEEW